MAPDKNLVNSMLDNLKDYLNRIEGMNIDLEGILEDEDTQDLVDRRMQLAIEICIDISAHIAAGLALPRKERASDVFLLLAENKIISSDLAGKMAGAVGLRNILVHEYTDIDYRLAYSNLKDKLDDLRSFAKEVSDFLDKANTR